MTGGAAEQQQSQGPAAITSTREYTTSLRTTPQSSHLVVLLVGFLTRSMCDGRL
jgi:hypothetical protein